MFAETRALSSSNVSKATESFVCSTYFFQSENKSHQVSVLDSEFINITCDMGP